MTDKHIGEVAQDLLDACLAYQAAEAMSPYGDASDFTFPKRDMRRPGDPAWGWVCEKHGLGYSGVCHCCEGEFAKHKVQKDADARRARDDALSAAREKARAAIAKATGAAP